MKGAQKWIVFGPAGWSPVLKYLNMISLETFIEVLNYLKLLIYI